MLPPYQPSQAPTWSPTHTVPAGGLPAWTAPAPFGPPIAMLPEGVELMVLQRFGEWARVAGNNGWTGWLDGRRLAPMAPPVPVAAPPYQPTLPPVPVAAPPYQPTLPQSLPATAVAALPHEPVSPQQSLPAPVAAALPQEPVAAPQSLPATAVAPLPHEPVSPPQSLPVGRRRRTLVAAGGLALVTLIILGVAGYFLVLKPGGGTQTSPAGNVAAGSGRYTFAIADLRSLGKFSVTFDRSKGATYPDEGGSSVLTLQGAITDFVLPSANLSPMSRTSVGGSELLNTIEVRRGSDSCHATIVFRFVTAGQGKGPGNVGIALAAGFGLTTDVYDAIAGSRSAQIDGRLCPATGAKKAAEEASADLTTFGVNARAYGGLMGASADDAFFYGYALYDTVNSSDDAYFEMNVGDSDAAWTLSRA